MTFNFHGALVTVSAALSATVAQPVFADALPPGFKPGHVASPKVKAAPPVQSGGGNGLPPVDSPALKGGVGSGLIFDSPVTGRGSVAAPSVLATWRGAPSNWSPPGLNGPGRGGGYGTADTNGDGRGASCERGNASFCPKPEPPIPHDPPGVPGPLPVLGAAATWGYSRKLRRRIR